MRVAKKTSADIFVAGVGYFSIGLCLCCKPAQQFNCCASGTSGLYCFHSSFGRLLLCFQKNQQIARVTTGLAPLLVSLLDIQICCCCCCCLCAFPQVGNSQVITATLLLGQVPQRTAPVAKSITRPKAVLADPVPLESVSVTFSRKDYNATDEKVAKASKDGKRTLICEDGDWVEFGEGTTEGGVATATLASPEFPGSTCIQAKFVTPTETTETTDTVTIAWYPPVPLPKLNATTTSTIVGNQSIVTATLLDDQDNAKAGVDVTFSVEGPAVQVPDVIDSRKSAPSIRDFQVTVTTDASGTASITLRSDSAGTSSVTAAYTTEGGREVVSERLDLTWTYPEPNFSKIKLWSSRKEAPVDHVIRVSAILLDDAEEPVAVAGINVRFAVARGDSDRAEMSAADAATDKFAMFAVTDENGVATVDLDSEWPGEFAVVATADNDQGTAVASNSLLVRWYASKHGYPPPQIPQAQG
jgi:hypothetical protein